MAKKRKRNAKRSTAKKQTSTLDIAVVALIILSILSGVLIYTKSGIVGIKLNEILGGMIGIVKFVLPVGIFAVAIKLACDKYTDVSEKILQYLVLILSISVLLCVYKIENIQVKGAQIPDTLKNAYSLGVQDIGGGALGALLAVPLVKLLGTVGAIILCIGVVIMLIVLTFGISTSEIINNVVERTKEKREDRLEEKQRNREEMLKEREEYMREKQKKTASKKVNKIFDEINNDNIGEQIKINFDGKLIDEEETKGLKKYNHDNDDLTPLTKETKKKIEEEKTDQKEEIQPDVIENNLFKQEEEKKEDKTKEVLQLEHAMIVEDENYEYPPLELLSKKAKKTLKGGARALTDTATKLQKTLYSFGVSAKVEHVSVGPAITRYELKPAEGVRVSKIANLADDIALNLAATTIRIEAPIPGKQAVGIEVPNKEKETVNLREVLESDEFQSNK